MSIALRKQLIRQDTSFGPLRFVEALPWLILAAALRVFAFGAGPIAIVAIALANIAILQAFILVAQRSIELAHGQTNLESLQVTEQLRISRAILGRMALLMIAGAAALSLAGGTSFAPVLLLGVDGMAFDQSSTIGKFWSATTAALVLLMVVGADENQGKVCFGAAVGEFLQRWVWLGASILCLGAIYVGLSFGQGMVRNAIWTYWQTSSHSQFVKNLVFFVFIFSFAMLRLWITLLILTFGLKQSYKS